MDNLWEQSLARFVKHRRGDRSMDDFRRQVGITQSTVFRPEQASMSITLRVLQQILRRLRCSLPEVLPGVCHGCPHHPTADRPQ